MDHKVFEELYGSAIKEFIAENERRHLSRDVRDDVISDSLLAFYKQCQKERIQEPLHWLRTAASRQTKAHVRKTFEHETQTAVLKLMYPHSTQPDWNGLVELDETDHSEKLVDLLSRSRAWSRLPSDRKRLLQLHSECISISSAAAQINRPLATVKSWLQRDKRSLRRDPVLQSIARAAAPSGTSTCEGSDDE